MRLPMVIPVIGSVAEEKWMLKPLSALGAIVATSIVFVLTLGALMPSGPLT